MLTDQIIYKKCSFLIFSFQNNKNPFMHFSNLGAKGPVGQTNPEPLLAAFAEGGAQDNEICLELSFKERDPNDRQVIAQIAESVAYWAPHIDSGAADLNI